MKERTCSKNSNVVKGKMCREDYLIKQIDKRSKSGKSNEDAAERHYSGTSDDGSRIWSF